LGGAKPEQRILTLQRIQRHHLFGAVLSGVLLTGAFPKFNLFLLAWVALVPLLISIRSLSAWDSFRVGLLAGIVHYTTLLYWIAGTMRAYGGVPWYLCVIVVLLFSVYLAAYVGIFSTLLRKVCRSPVGLFITLPILWVSLEYIRAEMFTGFPWELLGYTQYRALQIIQISDIFGVYGVSFLIALGNGCFFLAWLHLSKTTWHQKVVSSRQATAMTLVFITVLGAVYFYGKTRIQFVHQQIAKAASSQISVIQGNICQDVKWAPAFIEGTVDKYVSLSRSAGIMRPNLVVWPETATPFYFL
jgi:apolipoprotein N-acyltransferase